MKPEKPMKRKEYEKHLEKLQASCADSRSG